MNITTDGLKLIEQFEGWSSCPYYDSYGKVWTRGFGNTNGIGPESKCITRAEGEAELARLVDEQYAPAVRAIPGLNQNQFDALCSFVYNCGGGAIAAGTQIGEMLRKANWHAAADAMLQWDRSGGVVLPGLVHRRAMEVALLLKPVPVLKPDPYAKFTKAERPVVRKFDTLYPHRHAHLKEVQDLHIALVAHRKQTWQAAHRGKVVDWVSYDRGWRWQELEDRTRKPIAGLSAS